MKKNVRRSQDSINSKDLDDNGQRKKKPVGGYERPWRMGKDEV